MRRKTLSSTFPCPPPPCLPPLPAQAGSKKRTQKVTAEMRRKAALQRKVDREERAFGTRKEREEIFEVGLGKSGMGHSRCGCRAQGAGGRRYFRWLGLCWARGSASARERRQGGVSI